MRKNTIQLGKYQHYKNHQLYEVIGTACHTETQEEMVIYKALYLSDNFDYGQMWVRPKKMFFESVNYEGHIVPQFKYVE